MLKYLPILVFCCSLNINMVYTQEFAKINRWEKTRLQQAKTNPYDSANCIILDSLFNAYQHINFDPAKLIAEEAIDIGKVLNNYFILEHWYRNLGQLYSNYEIHAIGIEYYIKGLYFADKIGIKNNWWNINIGNIYFADKDYEKATKSYQEALIGFSESFNNDSIDAKKGKSVAFSNLGLVSREKNDYDSAIFYFKKSLFLRQQFYDLNSTVFACNLLAETYTTMNQFQNAEVYLNKAFKFDKETVNHAFLPETYLIQADVFKKRDQIEQALKAYNSAIEISSLSENSSLLVKSYIQLIDLHKENKQFNKAISFVLKAIENCSETENSQYRAPLMKEASDLYLKVNNSNKAYHYLNEYLIVKDTIESDKYNRLQSKYEIELSKARLSTVEDQLQSSNKENKLYRNWIIFGTGIIIIFFIVFLLLRLNTKALKKKNKKINEQNYTISAKNEEILQQNEEIKSINNQLDNYKNNLEQQIAEQTKDLAQSKENAEKADKLKTSFLENLSHEIRTPLNAIVGFTNLLEFEESLSEKSKQFLKHIDSSSNTLLSIIDSIMQVSNMQVGSYKLSQEKFNAYIFFQSLVNNIKQSNLTIQKKQLDVRTNLNIEPQTIINSDKESLKIVLFNLIDNAIKFTETGFIEIGVLKEKEELKFYVQDSGVGILKDEIKFVFDKFRKIDADKTKLYRGLGLGLTVSKNMVEQLGGMIWVESEVEKGTTFWVTIPIN